MHTRIKQVRKTVGLSQSAFGSKLGLSRDVINNLEQGRNKGGTPDYVVKLICQTYGVSEPWLRSGEGEMFSTAPQSAVDAFAAAHPDMTETDKALLEAYFALTVEQREAFLHYCLKVAEAYKAANGDPSRDIDAEVAAYRAELEAEAEAAAKSAALPATEGTTESRKEA